MRTCCVPTDTCHVVGRTSTRYVETRQRYGRKSHSARAMLPVLAGVIEFTQNQCNESENGFMDKVGFAASPLLPVARARPPALTDARTHARTHAVAMSRFWSPLRAPQESTADCPPCEPQCCIASHRTAPHRIACWSVRRGRIRGLHL